MRIGKEDVPARLFTFRPNRFSARELKILRKVKFVKAYFCVSFF